MLKVTIELPSGSVTRHYDEFNHEVAWFDEIEEMKEVIYQSTNHKF